MTTPPSLDTGTDDELLARAVQAGDPQAFERLVEHHLEAIHAFVSLKLPVPYLVDELTHESFVFAFRHIDLFTPGTSFRAWLRAIAANKIRAEIERYCREERNRLAYSERRALEHALQQAHPDEPHSLEALHRCLDELPEQLRALLNLKYQDENSSEQMAARLQRSVAWVRTTLCRVRQQLRECVEKKMRHS
jgi:RNA polymerase sigma-70 factor (ECF subfamily)